MSKKIYPIDYKKVVTLGGVPQHIRVRGTDASKPILLFIHGGPGVPDRHWVLKDQSGLANVSTMVCWDQRGAGKSYNKEQSLQPMTIDMMVNDAAELVEYLCREFNQEKVNIVGHSWGSMLGTLLAQRHPERIAAYVGMGQAVDLEELEKISYQFVIDEATRLGDKKALSDMAKIGPPVNGSYGSVDNLVIQRNYMTKYGGAAYNHKESIWSSVIIPVIQSPEYTLYDLYRYMKGAFYCLHQLWDEIAITVRFDQTVDSFAMPVYFTEGRHDKNTPPELAWAWYEQLQAPHKDWYWFEESGHSPIKEQPELWGKVIRGWLFD
ncbi:MAG: alpha/beta hydrolase [Coriobacteriales bacterium]|nr:alpha/beta hydrolase [Coriobacteriales bacterium]